MSRTTGRELALEALELILSEGAYANQALERVLKNSTDLERREKAFCTSLVYGVLRHLYKIDFYLGRLLSRPLKSLKLPVQNRLRLGLYQLIYLTEIPARAVCHTAVEEIKQSRYAGLAGLLNGVFRSYLRREEELKQLLWAERTDLVKFLSIEYSHPQWLISRWLARFGEQVTKEILQANQTEPPLTIRVNQLNSDPDTLREKLSSYGIEVTPSIWQRQALSLMNLPGSLEELTEFQNGEFFVQDESSMWVAPLLAPQPGETILDLCAAPGGKSTHLCELMQDQGRVISLDQHQHKVGLIAENAQRLRLQSLQPLLGDARQFKPDQGLMDAVLVDAPCSGTGVLRRRVDARYRKRPEEIHELVVLQREILNHAATLVRPGGRIVYSTCSIEIEENQVQIQDFLAAHPDFQAVPYQDYLPQELPRFQAEAEESWLTFLPRINAGDGFFICRLERKL